jgi:hypothetical protein
MGRPKTYAAHQATTQSLGPTGLCNYHLSYTHLFIVDFGYLFSSQQRPIHRKRGAT